MKKTILAFGEVLWDILPSCTVLGGAPFNFTYRVDSLGSGDAFSAGFTHKILRGASMEEAVAFGNVLGAIVATQTGATTCIAQEDIDRFLEQRVERSIHPEFRGELR